MDDFLKLKVKNYRGVEFIDVDEIERRGERGIGELKLWEDKFSFCFVDSCGVNRVYAGVFEENFNLKNLDGKRFAENLRRHTGLDFKYVSFRERPRQIIGVSEMRVSNGFEFYGTIIFADMIRERPLQRYK